MQKKFLAEAVKQAYKQGGNAILVKSAGIFFVLNLTDWIAYDTPAASFVNPIFNMDKADEIKNSTLKNLKRSERTRLENAFMAEIESNIQNIYELKEIEAIRDKIKILSDYNLSLKNPKSKIEKVIKKGTIKCNKKEKAIIRKANKEAKKANNVKK